MILLWVLQGLPVFHVIMRVLDEITTLIKVGVKLTSLPLLSSWQWAWRVHNTTQVGAIFK